MFDLIQILYWLSLSTWFGGVLFIAVAAPIILRTVRENNPIMTNVLSVNLEGQHGTLLGGTIVGRIMEVVLRIQLFCAGALLVALIGQWLYLRPRGTEMLPHIVRSVLYLAAVVLLVYQWRVIWPSIWRYRQEYIDHADEPDVANPALDKFNRYQDEGATLLFIMVGVLSLLLLLSASIRPVTTMVIPQS